MGMSPRSGPVRLPTYLDLAKADYVRGDLTQAELEERVAELLALGQQDRVPPPPRPDQRPV